MKNVIIYSFLIVVFCSCTQKTETDLASKSKGDSALLASDIYPQSCYPSEIEAYLNDADKSGTNIRNNPNGEIIKTLIKDDVNFEYMLRLTTSQDGWFKIKNPITGSENDIDIPGGEGWIHGSVISVDTRNYQGEHLKLLDKPEGGKILLIFEDQVAGLHLIEICGNWVKVEYNKHIGWIESKWLCGNPLTTCS